MKRVFGAVIELGPQNLAPGDLRSIVAEACSGDERIIREVISLLGHRDATILGCS